MATRLPPLNALRAFETSARCGGFKSAAREGRKPISVGFRKTDVVPPR